MVPHTQYIFPPQGTNLKLRKGSENIRSVQRPEGRDEALAWREEWAARQDRESRSPTDSGIKRACVAAHSAHIHQNCLKRLRPRASCPFFFSFVLLMLMCYTSLLIFFSLFPFSFSTPNFATASPFLSLHFTQFLFLPTKCVWLPSWQAVCENCQHVNENIWASGVCARKKNNILVAALHCWTFLPKHTQTHIHTQNYLTGTWIKFQFCFISSYMFVRKEKKF